MKQGNIKPLDNIPLPVAPVIIVHTLSFEQEILSGQTEIYNLLKIASLKTCPIVFTPINNQVINEILTTFDVDLASYYLENNQYIVKSKYIVAAFRFYLSSSRRHPASQLY